MSDFIQAVTRIVHEFRVAGLEVPDCILLKSHDEGMRLLAQLQKNPYLVYRAGDSAFGKPIEHPDGTCWMQVEVYGVKIRWPAMKMMVPKGGDVWA